MFERMYHLPENEAEPLPIGEWFYSLIWCPSQCYYRLNYGGIDYILYLRWRHEDPWQAVVVKNAASLGEMNTDKAVWSNDIFELHKIHYTDEEIELAKERVIELFYKYKADFPERILPKRNK